MSVQSELNDHEKRINECERKADVLEVIVHGKDGQNGLKSEIRELNEYVDELKPIVANLTRIYMSIEDIKSNVIKVLWVIVTSSIIALGGRFIQISFQDKTAQKTQEGIQELVETKQRLINQKNNNK